MKLFYYLEEKIFFLLYQIVFFFFLKIVFRELNLPAIIQFYCFLIFMTSLIFYFCFDYWKTKKEYQKIMQTIKNLEEKYLIAEVLPKPHRLKDKAYYDVLKLATKAMNDRMVKMENDVLEYQEYVESFAHEIKIPISALSLTYDNEKNYELKEIVKKMDNLIEQMLYYARSKNTEKDYFVKELNLAEVIHPLILNYKDYFFKNEITLSVKNLDATIYTDEKWLSFILSQIIQNSVKYFDKKMKKLEISCTQEQNKTILMIFDNGCGIKSSDLPRVFEKGFTGSDRKKENATGMGLYLAKKLCDQLNLGIWIESKEKEYTKIYISFPKGTIHQFKSN